MVTKYNIGDKVLVEGEIRSIKVKAYDNAVQVDYAFAVRDGSGKITLTQCEREIIGKENDGRVPVEALKDLYERMSDDICKALLMEIIEAYDVKENK